MRIRHYENVSIETYIPGFHPGSQGVYSARRVSARKSSRQCSRRRIRAECWWPAWRRGQSSSLTASESPVSPQSLVLSTPREYRDLQVNDFDHRSRAMTISYLKYDLLKQFWIFQRASVDQLHFTLSINIAFSEITFI